MEYLFLISVVLFLIFTAQVVQAKAVLETYDNDDIHPHPVSSSFLRSVISEYEINLESTAEFWRTNAQQKLK